MTNEELLETGSALYYPYIHPRDIGQLKCALLYWDRVRRIVPGGLIYGRSVMGDNKDAEALSAEGLLVSTSPVSYETNTLNLFLSKVEPHAKRLGISPEVVHKVQAESGGIHIEKIGYEAVRRLERLGLATRAGAWVGMKEEVGAYYMFCLASEMGAQMKATIFTDTEENATIGQSLLFQPRAAETRTDVLVKLGIQMPLPQELAKVPLKDFIKFTKESGGQRRAFREAIEVVLNAASSIQDPNALEDFLHNERAKLEDALKAHNSKLRELNLTTMNAVAALTAPAGFGTAIGSLLGPVGAAIGMAVGLTISGVACFVETRGKLKEAATSSPYHYVLSLEHQFGKSKRRK